MKRLFTVIFCVMMFISPSSAQVDCVQFPLECQGGAVADPVPETELPINITIKSKPKKIVKKKRKSRLIKKIIRNPWPQVLRMPPKAALPVVKAAPRLVSKMRPFQPLLKTPSWHGLAAVPMVKLEPDDFADIEGQFIINLDPAVLATEGINLRTVSIAALAAQLEIAPQQVRSVQRRYLHSVVVVGVSSQQAQVLADKSFVATMTPDTQIKAAGQVLPLSWGLDRLDAPTLPLDGKFERESGDYEGRIYLFDSAVETVALELGARIKLGESFLADSLNGKLGCKGHGTEMASLIAGATTGAAPKAEIVPLVVLPCGRENTGQASSLIEAVEWLLVREADFGDGRPVVANMSLAGKWSRAVNRAVAILTQNEVVVVVAAGNNAQDACRFSPASVKEAITVAATDYDDKSPAFSNFGKCVDVHAPGKLLTAISESSTSNPAPYYVAITGTSSAAALVSGLLVRSVKTKGNRNASQWLAKSSAPTILWRKDGSDLLLAQANADWRKQCRLEEAIGIRQVTLESAPVTLMLPKNTFAAVVQIRHGWVNLRASSGLGGWTENARALKQPDSDLPCEAAR